MIFRGDDVHPSKVTLQKGRVLSSQENILALIDPVARGLDMRCSEGTADCAK